MQRHRCVVVRWRGSDGKFSTPRGRGRLVLRTVAKGTNPAGETHASTYAAPVGEDMVDYQAVDYQSCTIRVAVNPAAWCSYQVDSW